MNVLRSDSRAEFQLTFQYSSATTQHTDHFYCQDVNLWRDAFTPEQLDVLTGANEGDYRELIGNEVIIPYDKRKRFLISSRQWQPPKHLKHHFIPQAGRWYPQGYVSGVATIFPQSTAPLRCVHKDSNSIDIDANHPLAGVKVSAGVTVKIIKNQNKERGGRCHD